MISPAAALRNLENARAIENGILYMTVIPMFLKFCLYGVGFAMQLPVLVAHCSHAIKSSKAPSMFTLSEGSSLM
jgi:hypothetical protein